MYGCKWFTGFIERLMIKNQIIDDKFISYKKVCGEIENMMDDSLSDKELRFFFIRLHITTDIKCWI